MVVGQLTGRPSLRSGSRQLLLGAVAVAVSYGVGLLIGPPRAVPENSTEITCE